MRLFKFLLLALALFAVQGTVGAATPPNDAEVEAEGADEHSTEDIEEAREEFNSIDTDTDGFLTREEIMAMEEVPEQEEIDEFFETYDQDKDGKVRAPAPTAPPRAPSSLRGAGLVRRDPGGRRETAAGVGGRG